MRLHADARLGPRGRRGWSTECSPAGPVKDAAVSAGVSTQACRKWVTDTAEGAGGLHERAIGGERLRAVTTEPGDLGPR